MHLKTLLNLLEEHRGFVFGQARFGMNGKGERRIEFPVRPLGNSRAICSGCGKRRATHDHLGERTFEYVPIWNIPVALLYAMRRVNCMDCGVKVERVPWAAGKSPITRTFSLFLADWAKSLSWQEVTRRFGVNWRQVFESVRLVVEWGLTHRDLSGVSAFGINELQFGKGHQYLTVVYQLCGDTRRLLYVGKKREAVSLSSFLDDMGSEWCNGITHVCTDMWRAYLKVAEERLLNAVHILDRFHIVKLLNEAVDEVRKEEAAKLRKQGVDLLKGMKYVFLKNPENLTEKQQEQLNAVLSKRWLASVRAYLWKEKFQLFWEYDSPRHARKHLRRWCKGAMRSRLTPLKKYVKTIRKHEPLIMNWFIAKKAYSSGAVEGMNRKINLVTRKS